MNEIQQKLERNTLNTVSLFSGAGGLDIGAIMSGANIVWANDKMREACDSYSKNIGNVRTALLSRLRSLGYSVGLCVLNATDYDVPQARERMFIVGFKGSADAQINLDMMLKPYRKKPKRYVTIHPFDDGNGRLCRTITEMLLSRADRTEKRYYSLSSQILQNHNAYYDQLERAQKGTTDVTEWVAWFLATLNTAVQDAINKTEHVVRKRQFWDSHSRTPLNERQRKVLNRLLDGFDGKLNSSKWYKICHCSQDTATRDINDLVAKGILRKTGDGRKEHKLRAERMTFW